MEKPLGLLRGSTQKIKTGVSMSITSVEKEKMLFSQEMELCVPFRFRASHKLSVREELHPHDWALTVCLSRKIFKDDLFVVNIVDMRKLIQPMVDALKQKNLNDIFSMPTCEHLCVHFMNVISHGLNMMKNADEVSQDVQLVSVEVGLMEDEEPSYSNTNKEWGSVKMMNPWRINND